MRLSSGAAEVTLEARTKTTAPAAVANQDLRIVLPPYFGVIGHTDILPMPASEA
jgi:hypothetical protein